MALKNKRNEGTDFAPLAVPTQTVLPNLMTIDGHYFRINYDVPEEITSRFLSLLDEDKTYKDVPEVLKAYEVMDPFKDE